MSEINAQNFTKHKKAQDLRIIHFYIIFDTLYFNYYIK